MMNRIIFSLFSLVFLFTSCTVYKKTTATDDGHISINFVQINDVYEIAPLNNGKDGGIARVATLKKKYVQENKNTLLLMAGDFLSPSVYNSLKYKGESIKGKQMVEALNAAGLDIAIFGNHEFDIKEAELQQRINESSFQWISSNTFHKKKDGKISPFAKTNTGKPEDPFPKTFIKTFTDADGTTAKIGFFAVTLPFNKASYVFYEDALAAAKKSFSYLIDSVDAVIAITHQTIEEDRILASEIPGLSLIMGGHEHDQHFEKHWDIYISKAMANARSAYVLTLNINKKNKQVSVTPKLEKMDEQVALDSNTHKVVTKWVNIANESYAALGFEPGKIIVNNMQPLDGRETEVRSYSTNLCKLIVSAMQSAAPQSPVVIMNAGSIRVDDILQMPVTQYDILRTLPYGGAIKEADITGSLLVQILDAGTKNKGTGGYLLYNETIRYNPELKNWSIGDTVIDPAKIFRVALTDFLLTGGEANLDFLKPGNSGILKVYDTENSLSNPRADIRRAVIQYLQARQ